jgi:hypothetical protein
MRIFASFVQCRKMRSGIYQKIAHGLSLSAIPLLLRQESPALRWGWQQDMYATLKKTLSHFHSTLC